MDIITVNESRCVGCNACVRVCPVHANTTRLKDNTVDEFITTIKSDACIQCGECVKACTHNARGYKDDIDVFAKALESKEKIIVIVAPSIRTSFPGKSWKIVLQRIRELGNVEIYDVGFGADICTFMYNKYIKENPDKKVITQPCPAIVNYIEKYQPELIPNLSPVMSPVGCLAKWLKVYKHKTEKMFMLSPCIAKTSEARREKAYDYNVTFKTLETYFKKTGISWNVIPLFQFDELEGGIGRMFPMPGGLKSTMQLLNNELVIRNAEGPHSVYDAIDRYGKTKENTRADILDVLNCEFGCNYGTATSGEVASLAEVEQIMDDITAVSIKENSGGFLGIGKMKRFKEFEKTLKLNDFITSYKDKSVKRAKPTHDDYQKIFDSMKKTTVESHVVNCGACGYKSCIEMAYAIYNGLNVRENCVYYLKQSLKEKYTQLKNLYENVVAEVNKITEISKRINTEYQDVITKSSAINRRSTDLANNSLLLKKTCDKVFEAIDTNHPTKENFIKLYSFVTGISKTATAFYSTTDSFAKDTGVVIEDAEDIAKAINELNKLSEEIQKLIED